MVTRALFAELTVTVVVPIVASSEPGGVTIGAPSPNINSVVFAKLYNSTHEILNVRQNK